MNKRVVLYSLAAVLAGVVAADLISGGKLIRLPETEDSVYEKFSQINAKLLKAGTAKVRFDARLEQGGVWTGTSSVRFGDEDHAVWDTAYTKATAGTKASIELRRLHTGFRKDFYSSPALKPADGRAWFTPDRADLGTGLTSPQNNVGDITTWLPFVVGVDKYRANQSKTDVLDDVDGAPDEFRFRCGKEIPACPPPWDTPLDDVFNTATIGPVMDIWLDGDGRLRRLEVQGTLDYLNGDGSRDLSRLKVPSDVKITFELSDFGTPVDVRSPADSEITGEYVG